MRRITKVFAPKTLFSLFLCLFCGLTARADTQTLEKLSRGASLMLQDGTLRALDGKGGQMWQLSRREAKIVGDDTARTDFALDSVVFSRDKRFFALRGDEAAQIRETATGKIRFSIALYPQTASETAQEPRFQLANWKLRPAMLPGPGTFVTGMAFSPDGHHFALSGWQDTEVSYRSDGSFRRIFAAGRVRVFDLQKGALTRDFDVKGAHVRGARWTSRRRIVASCGDGKQRVFSLATR